MKRIARKAWLSFSGVPCFVAVVGVLASVTLRAQDSSSKGQDNTNQTQDVANKPQDTAIKGQDKPPELVARPNPDSYAVSLGTGELINLNVPQSTGSTQGADPNSQGEYIDGMRVKGTGKQLNGRLFYGLSAATGYTDSVSGLGISPGFSSTVNPFVALLRPTRTGSFLLQYSATIAPNDVYSRDTEVFHTFGGAIQGALSRRWFWTISGSGNYGSQLARLQAPLNFVVVQGTPVVNAGSTAVLLRSNNVAFTEGMAHLEWWKSPQETLGFAVVHSYTRADGDPAIPLSTPSSSNTIGVKADYNRIVSSRLAMQAYGEMETLIAGSRCESIGGGLGVSMKVNQKVGLNFAGGPQFTTPGCGGSQSANFSAAVTVNLTNRDRFYLSANRQFSAAYQTNGVWEDNVAAGFSKVKGRFTLTTDSGYVHAQQRSPLLEPYRGYFVTPKIGMRISETLSCSAAYRNFHGFGGDLGRGNLSLSVFSIEWHPSAIHVK